MDPKENNNDTTSRSIVPQDLDDVRDTPIDIKLCDRYDTKTYHIYLDYED